MAASSQSFGDKIVKTLGGLKFAVFLLMVLAIYLTVGTIVESLYGTEFAGRLIYKSVPFMALLFFFYACIFMAMLLRLPLKKALYGFYTVHIGMILMLLGSVLTYVAGIDGNLTLAPLTPSRQLMIPRDVIKIYDTQEGKTGSLELPYSAFKTTIDKEFGPVQVKEYYPFAENELVWQKDDSSKQSHHSSTYKVKNAFVAQELTLSLHPKAAEFESSTQMGPLSVHYLPAGLAPCFKNPGKNKIIVWDSNNEECFTPAQKELKLGQTDKGNRHLTLTMGDRRYTFFPDFSPWPITKSFTLDRTSPYRVFSLKLFEEKPTIFAFGEAVAFFEEGNWKTEELKKGTPAILPWMSMEFTLLRHEANRYPAFIPNPVVPIQENGKLVVGDQKAVRIEVGEYKDSYWVRSGLPLSIEVDGKKYEVGLSQKSFNLPYELTLTRFKMDTNPGTSQAASYESFVDLFTGGSNSKHHIFMNNPLKYDGLTFYQASYFETQQGYGSVLSVNYDPGRFVKYLGALLLVLGSAWHFYIRRKKVRATA